MIEGRYPLITIIASNSMLSVCVIYLVLSYLQYYGYMTDDDYIESDKFYVNLDISAGQIFAFICCTLILYRTWLIHIKWSELKKDGNIDEIQIPASIQLHTPVPSNTPVSLNTPPMSTKSNHSPIPSKSVTIDIESDSMSKNYDEIFWKINKRSIVCRNISILIIIFGCIITGIGYYFRTKTLTIVGQSLWVGVSISAIIIIFKTWKTKEALNCISECYIVILILILIIIG